MRVLVVNAGSSSLKLAVLDGEEQIGARLLERWDGAGEQEALRRLLAATGPVDAVGHRVVHGGADHTAAVRVDAAVLAALDELVELAPLHQPRALAAIRSVGDLLPQVPAVACFDTAFHTTIPLAAATYALPAAWNARWRLRRYGFHGLSHAYATQRAAALVGRSAEQLRLVSCHLGAGASLCAVAGGRSVDTTMGFTPLAGLVMATRSGTLDPGLLIWLLEHAGIPLAELSDTLEHRAGLAGLSGTSGDLRDVLAAADGGDEAASLAYDVFLHRLAREVAAMVAATRGLDVLSVTGGIGENSARVRADLAERLAHLGVAVDPQRNADTSRDADISADGAAVRTVVVTSREDLQIVREVRALLSAR